MEIDLPKILIENVSHSICELLILYSFSMLVTASSVYQPRLELLTAVRGSLLRIKHNSVSNVSRTCLKALSSFSFVAESVWLLSLVQRLFLFPGVD